MALMKKIISKKNLSQEIEIFAGGNIFSVTIFAQTEGMKRTIISSFIISKVVRNQWKIHP